MRYESIVGKKFNRLYVLKQFKENGRMKVLCKCDCENLLVACKDSVKSGHTKSCGCYNIEKIKERLTIHGQRIEGITSKEYEAWRAMKSRCYDINDKRYKNYGGRGIKVCDEWINSFEEFYKYIGKAPSDKHSLDRINNDGNYEPGNIRWANIIEQANNRSNNNFKKFNGKKQSLAQWSRELNIGQRTLWSRLYRDNWTMEEAFTIPVGGKRKSNGK